MPFLNRVRAALKSFTAMVFGGRGSWSSGLLPRTNYDYASAVGDGRQNSIVMASVLWIMRTFPEAPMRVLARKGAELTPVPGHALLALLRRPNNYYSGILLWMATIADWTITGNAYWLKVRSASGKVVELWWIPSTIIEPCWPNDGSAFISHYEYSPNGRPLRVDVADVVHFRYGLDPNNPRKGLAPLGSVLREAFTDDEAANFSASILKNLGVPGVIIAPSNDKTEIAPDAAEEIKSSFTARFGGDNRGAPMVMSLPITATVLSFSPQQMDLKGLRRVPEERITAVLGLPAAVAGMGAGLDRSTFANYSEMREAAYEGNIIPAQRLLAEELRTQLLPDFADVALTEIDFDLSGVRVLQTDQNELHARAREDLKSGLITLNQALGLIGIAPDPDGDVLYVPISVQPTKPADLLLPPPSPAPLALPAPKSLELDELKAAITGFAPGVRRVRTRLEGPLVSKLASYLSGSATRVTSALRSTRAAADDTEIKAIVDDVFDESAEADRLRVVLNGSYSSALDMVAAIVREQLSVSFEIDDPLTRAYLREAGKLITNITETTRKAVAEALAEGQAEGESYQQLATRIRALPEFGRTRAQLIARTELGQATNEATLLSFRESGVVKGVEFVDGTDHDSPCKEINGKRMTLAAAQSVPRLAHPRCVRCMVPLTSARDLA